MSLFDSIMGVLFGGGQQSTAAATPGAGTPAAAAPANTATPGTLGANPLANAILTRGFGAKIGAPPAKPAVAAPNTSANNPLPQRNNVDIIRQLFPGVDLSSYVYNPYSAEDGE